LSINSHQNVDVIYIDFSRLLTLLFTQNSWRYLFPMASMVIYYCGLKVSCLVEVKRLKLVGTCLRLVMCEVV